MYGDDGRLLNATFLDYRLPTCLDVPMIDAVMVEVPNPSHPYGVRGVGEIPIVPPPAAIANAIYNAVDVRMTILRVAGGRLGCLWEHAKKLISWRQPGFPPYSALAAGQSKSRSRSFA